MDQIIDSQFDQIVELRRWMHSYPELSGAEYETSRHLKTLLTVAGIDAKLGPDGRGVICDLDTGDDSHKIALRADIDALPIQDAKHVPYHSCHDGVMHACGHDAHTGLVFGAAIAIHELAQTGRLPWPVPLRCIFQPAEETCTGAREMIFSGAIDQVAAILSTHVDPLRNSGEIGMKSGVLTANCDELIFTIRGRGGHAARPHQTRDPISAGVQLVNSLYAQIPRITDSHQPVVVSISQFIGGENANVIPETAQLKGTLRTLDRDTRQLALNGIRHICDATSLSSGTSIEFDIGISSPSVMNDTQLTELLCDAARQVVGPDHLKEILHPSMGGEDFAFYLERIPGAMIRLGCGGPEVGHSGLHTPTFDVDEQTMRIGAAVLARAAIVWSDPSGPFCTQANTSRSADHL